MVSCETVQDRNPYVVRYMGGPSLGKRISFTKPNWYNRQTLPRVAAAPSLGKENRSPRITSKPEQNKFFNNDKV